MTSKTNFFQSILRIGWVGALVIAASCQDSMIQPVNNGSVQEDLSRNAQLHEDRVRTFYGPAAPMGQGVARAWVSVNNEGEPVSLGVNISERAAMHQPEEHVEYVLELPKAAAAMPFNHVTLGWNPHGHFPPGVYDVPHFDVHFNMIDIPTRLAIPGMAPPYMDPALASQYVPAGYIQTPGVEPAMGAHWVDIFSDEFQAGGVFTNTLILGSYNANVIFWEPMVTVQYLMTHPDDVRPVRQPAAYQVSGYYPLTYSVTYHESPDEFRIALDNLVFRQAQ